MGVSIWLRGGGNTRWQELPEKLSLQASSFLLVVKEQSQCFSSCPLLCAKQSTTCLSIGSPMEELMNPNWCSQSSKNQLISDFLKLLHQIESQTLLHLFQVCEKHLVSRSETQFSYLQDGIIKGFFLGSL